MFYLEQKEEWVLKAGIALMVVSNFISNLGLYGGRTSPAILVECCILTIVTVVLYRNHKISNKIPLFLLIVLWGIGVSFAISGLIYKVPTYLIDAIIFILQLPFFWACVRLKDIENTVKSFSWSYALCFFICFCISALVSPLTGGQYYGIFNNPNLFGECLTMAVLCIVFLIEQSEFNNKKKVIFLFALFGIAVALIIFTRSRTSILSLALILLVYFIYLLRHKNEILKKICILAVAVIVLLSASYGMLMKVTPLICKQTGITFDTKEQKSEVAAAGDLSSEVKKSYSRMFKGISGNGSFTSGRSEIWGTYLNEVSVRGHAPDYLPVLYRDKIIKANSHNTFIQVAYQAGVVAGICFLIFIMYTWIMSIKYIFKRRLDPYRLVAIAGIWNAIPYLLLSNNLGPYSSFTMTVVWVICVPILYSISNRLGKKNE